MHPLFLPVDFQKLSINQASLPCYQNVISKSFQGIGKSGSIVFKNLDSGAEFLASRSCMF